MRIILLYGLPNTGKTTTINLVYDELIKKGAYVIKKKRKIGKNPKDFKSVLKYNDKIITFYSMGDDHRNCERAVKTSHESDFLVLAYSTKNKTRCKLYNTTSGDPQNIIMAKTVCNTYDENKFAECNFNDTQRILSIIK